MGVALGATGRCVIGDIIVLVFFLYLIDHADVVISFHRCGWAVIVDGGTDALVIVSPPMPTFWETTVCTCDFQVR